MFPEPPPRLRRGLEGYQGVSSPRPLQRNPVSSRNGPACVHPCHPPRTAESSHRTQFGGNTETIRSRVDVSSYQSCAPKSVIWEACPLLSLRFPWTQHILTLQIVNHVFITQCASYFGLCFSSLDTDSSARVKCSCVRGRGLPRWTSLCPQKAEGNGNNFMHIVN